MNFVEHSERRGGVARRVFLLVGFGIVTALVVGFLWATATPGSSYEGPARQPSDSALASRLETHVRTLAAGPRNLQRLASVQHTIGYLTTELRSYGYDPELQEVVSPADNVIVRIPAAQPDAPILIIGAHYDTAGSSPGADDNASGVAALLELARALKANSGTSPIELELVFYANEEPPHFKTNAMGSHVHAHSVEEPDDVLGMISIEAIGYYSENSGSQHYPFPLSLRYPSKGNFIAFVGDTSSRDFLRRMVGSFRENARIPSVGGTAPAIIQGIDWSDHWAYSQRGIPAFMITDTAIFRNPHYHRPTDTAEKLDFGRMALVVEGLEAMLRSGLAKQSSN